MRKRRKRTNVNVPAKGRLKDMADQVWSLAVKNDWDHQCAVCGHRGDLNSHHLIPRGKTATRYMLANGICLCRRCHQFCPDVSPHQNAAGFILWLEEHHPDIAEQTFQECESCVAFSGTTNALFYCDILRELREYIEPDDFRRIVGAKFSDYLDDSH